MLITRWRPILICVQLLASICSLGHTWSARKCVLLLLLASWFNHHSYHVFVHHVAKCRCTHCALLSGGYTQQQVHVCMLSYCKLSISSTALQIQHHHAYSMLHYGNAAVCIAELPVCCKGPRPCLAHTPMHRVYTQAYMGWNEGADRDLQMW